MPSFVIGKMRAGEPGVEEAVRLERAYIATLREIIEKYPMTKSAKEAKELLDKMRN